jgi:hypothetical protein
MWPLVQLSFGTRYLLHFQSFPPAAHIFWALSDLISVAYIDLDFPVQMLITAKEALF